MKFWGGPPVDAPDKNFFDLAKLHGHRSLGLKFQLSSSFHMAVPHSQSFGSLRSQTFPPPLLKTCKNSSYFDFFKFNVSTVAISIKGN